MSIQYLRFVLILLVVFLIFFLLGILNVATSLQLSKHHDVQMYKLLECHLARESQEAGQDS